MVRDRRIKRPDEKNRKQEVRRHRFSKQLGMLALSVIVVALGLAVSLMIQPQLSTAQSTRSDETALGVFASVADGVWINEQRALPGMSIMPGDLMRTDASGRARLTFMRNSTLQLAGNTQVRVLTVVDATPSRSRVLVLSLDQGVGRMVAGDPAEPEIALIRGGGGGAVISGGTLDMVSSNQRLVTVMRSGKSSCRAANAVQLSMTEKQRACILSSGTARPSMLSAAMKRVIDERLSIPPSTQSLAEPEPTAPLTSYAINALNVEGDDGQERLQNAEPSAEEGQTQTLLQQLWSILQ